MAPRAPKKPRTKAKPAPDPKLLLAKLRARLEKESAALERRRRRLFRCFHTYESQFRLVTRIARRVAKLESP